MALFVFWREPVAGARDATALDPILLAEAHIVPEGTVHRDFATPAGRWHLTAFVTRTHFYSVDDQVWERPGEGACVIHGLIWRLVEGRPRLLDAQAVASLLDRPGALLPDDVAGEYAVARLHPDGTLTAYSDRPGLHQLFHGAGGEPVVANRAALVAAVLGDRTPDPAGLRWLAAIGYRVGPATAYRAVSQLGQEGVLGFGGDGMTIGTMPDPIVALGGERGFISAGRGDALDEGIAQAMAAIAIGTATDGPIDLPITGGKDSRVVLALCLAAGLKGRLRLFTRGYAGHPDVIAGAGIAAALGLPHRREAPHGSDEPAHWTRERFFTRLMAQAWQSDGMVGGWDLILGERIAAETLITGHMGEVLKAYSKKPLPDGPLDPAAMVRLQAPFDPMGIFRPEARAALEGELAAQMAEARGQGALEADLPDIFYYRNRVPNWLGAIRAIKSFERQPVVPLGAPALLRLAFRLTPEERKRELLHYRIIERCAPELLPLPFAQQGWDAALGDDVPRPAPILPGAGAPPTFGNWQFSLNHVPGIRAALSDVIAARGDLTIWESIDRDAVLDRLRNRRLDYFDGISMLGLVVAMFQESAMTVSAKIGALPADAPSLRACPDPAIVGHIDAIRRDGDRICFDGWAHIPEWPAVQVALEARAGGEALGRVVAGNDRPDLVAHGVGDGRHGFSLGIARERLPAVGEIDVTIAAFDSDAALATLKVSR